MLTTDPSTLRPVVDVRDLADLTVGLLERRVYGLYNVASQNLSVGDAADVVSLSTQSIAVREHGSSADPRNYAVDTSKLSGEAPWWKPRSIRQSVDDVADYYRKIGLTGQDVKSRRYHRISQYAVSV